MSISDVANISITAETRGISRAGFGTLAILSLSNPAGITDAVASYASDAEMAAAGWPAMHPVRRKAAAVFAQENHTSPIKVLNGQDASLITTLELTFNSVLSEGDDMVFVVYRDTEAGADTITVATPATPTPTNVATAVAAAIDALSGITATSSVGVVTVVSDTGGGFFSIDYPTGNPFLSIDFEDTTGAGGGEATVLDAISDIDSDWYGLITVAQSAGQIEAIAAWVESNGKLYAASNADTVVPSSSISDVATALKDDTLGRSFVVWHPDHSDTLAAGLMGQMLATTVGTAQWQFKEIPLTSTPDNLTTTKIGFLKTKNVTYVTRANGRTATRGGKVAGGEWIDIVRLIDFLRARIGEDLYVHQLNNPKIAYTVKGIQSIVSLIKGRLDSKVNEGLRESNPEPTVTAPAPEDVLASDKIARNLPDVEFVAGLEGAIILTNITGRLLP